MDQQIIPVQLPQGKTTISLSELFSSKKPVVQARSKKSIEKERPSISLFNYTTLPALKQTPIKYLQSAKSSSSQREDTLNLQSQKQIDTVVVDQRSLRLQAVKQILREQQFDDKVLAHSVAKPAFNISQLVKSIKFKENLQQDSRRSFLRRSSDLSGKISQKVISKKKIVQDFHLGDKVVVNQVIPVGVKRISSPYELQSLVRIFKGVRLNGQTQKQIRKLNKSKAQQRKDKKINQLSGWDTDYIK